jgi:hypothetical protein
MIRLEMKEAIVNSASREEQIELGRAGNSPVFRKAPVWRPGSRSYLQQGSLSRLTKIAGNRLIGGRIARKLAADEQRRSIFQLQLNLLGRSLSADLDIIRFRGFLCE